MEQNYATDITDDQWQIIESLLPACDPKKGGRPRMWSQREILNAIFYMERTGCQWRMLPRDFPPKETVWQQFRKWREEGTLEVIRESLNYKYRPKMRTRTNNTSNTSNTNKKTMPSMAMAS